MGAGPIKAREAVPRRGRRTTIAAGAACAVVLAIGGACLVALLPRIVTMLAFRDASRLAAEYADSVAMPLPELDQLRRFDWTKELIDDSAMVQQLATSYGSLFRKGYIDPAYWMGQVPELGLTPDGLPAFIVLSSYLSSLEYDPIEDRPSRIVSEWVRWVRPLLESAAAKESMVNLLLRDVEPMPGKHESGEVLKLVLLSILTLRDVENYGSRDRQPELEAYARRVIESLGIDAWEPVLRHVDHPGEKTRASALLLLCHHPDRAIFEARARAALADPAEIVRIAAAGTLAYHGLADGERVLIAGLSHGRREARWWCGKSLTYFGSETAGDAILAWKRRETDPWVQGEIEDMLPEMK